MTTTETTALAPTTGTALAAPSKPKTVRDWLSTPAFRDEIAKALPKHCTPDRFLRVALTALVKTPKLANCTPASVCNALLTLSQFGLEPDGRRAHLIPYGDQCTLIIDWKGLAELILRSGLVSYLHASEVCENDLFDYNMGEVQKHTVDFKKPRGKVYAFYSLCKFRDGTAKADVMTLDEVRAIQNRSKAGRAGPWITDFNEMGKKTVFRRLSKWLPLSPEILAAVEADDDVIDIDGKQAPQNGGLASLVDMPSMPEENGNGEGAKNVTPEANHPPEYTAADREKVIDILKNRILDGNTSAEAMLKSAKSIGSVRANYDGELFELPTADLVRIAEGKK